MAPQTSTQLGFAWLTAPGSAALALLWLTPPLFAQLFNRPLTEAHRLIHWRSYRGAEIDQVLAWRGSDGFWLSLHGGPATRAAAETALAEAGACPLPVPNLWEAPHRLQQEALADLPQAAGALGARLVLACVEQGRAALDHARTLPPAELHGLAQAWAEARFLYQPPRVQLWGPVNAGKSSLLNALCGRDLAATGEEPGLTRDVIEGQCEHEGFALRLFDAPGVNHGGGALNDAATQLAERWRAQADLTLELVPPGRRPLGVGGMVVHSRADQWPAAPQPAVSVNDTASLTRLKHDLCSHFIGRLLALPAHLQVALPRAMVLRLAAGEDPAAVVVS